MVSKIQLPGASLGPRTPTMEGPETSPWHLGPVPSVDGATLDEALMAYVESVPADRCFELLSYKSLARQKAANGADLVRLEPLLQPLLAAQPCGRFKPKQLQDGIQRLLARQPALNRSSFNAKLFFVWLSTQILVALTHLRRLRCNQVRYREATSQMVASDVVALDRMLRYVASTEVGCPEAAGSSPTPGPKRARRQLQPHVSVDSEGFPDLTKVLCDDEGEASTIAKAPQASTIAKAPQASTIAKAPQVPDSPSSSDPELRLLAEALLRSTRPACGRPSHDSSLKKEAEVVAAAAPVPARRGAMRQEAMKKRPDAKVLTERVGENSVMGKLRLTVATKKAYICALQEETKKWFHIVSVYDKVPDFTEVAMKLLRYASTHECDKEALNALRNKWVQEIEEGKDWKDLDSSASEASLE